MINSTWLVSKTVLIEAVRRREVYAIVLVSVLLIGAVMTVDFFGLRGLSKFYAEIALKVMSASTALTVIILAARQLPREFEGRTIYPLLAKPISRRSFLLGKVLGVLMAAAFCLALFMSIYIAGTLYLGATPQWGLLAQFVYLQLLAALVLAALSLWLSLIVNLDAAITMAAIFYFLSSVMSNAAAYIYDFTGTIGQWVIWLMTFAIPQLGLFDLSEKTVHGDVWAPLDLLTMTQLTVYGLLFAGMYAAFALICFRRRAL